MTWLNFLYISHPTLSKSGNDSIGLDVHKRSPPIGGNWKKSLKNKTIGTPPNTADLVISNSKIFV
jgi:hypothetical protein